MPATGSLELKAEKQSAHSDMIFSVAFNNDGSKIVSGSRDRTIKVWDANPRPFDASEWEEVDISGMEKVQIGSNMKVQIEGLGYVDSNYWRNKVTGELRKEYGTAGARLGPRTDQSLGCRYPSPPDPSSDPKLSSPTLATGSLELKAEKKSAHSHYIRSVAFNNDGTKIVSGSDDKTIKVWDAGTYQHSPTPHVHTSEQPNALSAHR